MNEDEWLAPNYRIILIDEEYGSDSWYSIVSNNEYQEIEKNWKTIRGLNCLVPVQFLIPSAQNFPIRSEHEKFTRFRTLVEEKVEIISCHIHETDDSYLNGLKTIPDEDFWFCGKKYSEDEVLSLFNKYQNFDTSGRREIPTIWRVYDNFGDLHRRYREAEWPEDDLVPDGWIRKGNVIVRKKFIVKKTGQIVEET